MSKTLTLLAAFLAGVSAVAQTPERPVIQSLAEVAPKADETALLLAKSLFARGSFQQVPAAQEKQLLSLLNSTLTKDDGRQLPQRLLLAGAFNGVGGGGGIVCFDDKAKSAAALDEAGRLKRSALAQIKDFDTFDTFRVIHGSQRRWDEAVQGQFHLRQPLPGERAETFLRRVLYQNVLAFFPLLVERLMAVMVRYPFRTWQPVPAGGLPFYPDLDDKLFANVRGKENTCVYAQIAIRAVKNSGKSAEQVQYFYDKELLERVHVLANSEEDFQRWLAILILHEDSYLLAKELGAQTANDVHKIIEMALFDDADIDQMKVSFFEPGSPNVDRIDQGMGQLFEKPYEDLLAKEPSIAPWPSKLTLYQAWMHTMKREQALRKEQEARGCQGDQCISASGLMWRNLFSHPDEVAALTPAEAYFALTPSMSFNNDLPSPEALVARSVDPRGALTYSCQKIDFSMGSFVQTSVNTGETLTLDPQVGRVLFAKIKEFCGPALKKP